LASAPRLVLARRAWAAKSRHRLVVHRAWHSAGFL